MNNLPISANQSRETSPLDPPRVYDINNDVMRDVTHEDWVTVSQTVHRLMDELRLLREAA